MSAVKQIQWGPLSEPVHQEVEPGAPPWRDNAFLSFWDPERGVFGTLHVSTSPNAEGRRARLSAQADERVLEVVEELDPGTFSSRSVSFDAGASFEVDHPRVSGALTFAPFHALADYTGDRAPRAFSLDQRRPIMHYQRAAEVSGTLVLDGREQQIQGHGFRDRTWGYREESTSVAEYFGWMVTFPDFAMSVMKLRGEESAESTLGFLLGDEAIPVTDTSLTRDASGLFAGARATLADGREVELRSTARRAGFWCPMGVERTGPTLSAYDEFCSVRTSDGREGFALIEQGILKRVY